MADRDSIRIAGAEHDPVGDYLHTAGGTDLRGGVNRMEGYRFDELYGQIKDVVSAYSDSGERAAAIAGYMRCMDPDEVLTIEQINMILALRDPGEME